MENSYARNKSADRSCRLVFYGYHGRSVRVVYVGGFGAAAHTGGELE
jgi:hypothetical protein